MKIQEKIRMSLFNGKQKNTQPTTDFIKNIEKNSSKVRFEYNGSSNMEVARQIADFKKNLDYEIASCISSFVRLDAETQKMSEVIMIDLDANLEELACIAINFTNLNRAKASLSSDDEQLLVEKILNLKKKISDNIKDMRKSIGVSLAIKMLGEKDEKPVRKSQCLSKQEENLFNSIWILLDSIETNSISEKKRRELNKYKNWVTELKELPTYHENSKISLLSDIFKGIQNFKESLEDLKIDKMEIEAMAFTKELELNGYLK